MNKSPSACIEQLADIAKVVLMPGDPLRAKTVAENYLENPVLFNSVRNMLGYTGMYKGRQISVMGSGMGIPSITLYAYELYHFFGVESILRIGSAGALPERVQLRDVVMALAASTNSGVVQGADFPGTLAPCADFALLQHAAAAAKIKGTPHHVGPVFTSDYFYNPSPAANQQLRELGMLAVEMEAAGLYACAQRAGKRALGIFTISDHIFRGEELTAEQRQNSFRDMMEIALEAAWQVAG